jgi:hypothetical protein
MKIPTHVPPPDHKLQLIILTRVNYTNASIRIPYSTPSVKHPLTLLIQLLLRHFLVFLPIFKRASVLFAVVCGLCDMPSNSFPPSHAYESTGNHPFMSWTPKHPRLIQYSREAVYSLQFFGSHGGTHVINELI